MRCSLSLRWVFTLAVFSSSLGLVAGARAQTPDAQADSAIALQGFVVTATPVPIAEGALGAHASVLSGEALRARGITRVVDALRSSTGITLVQSGSFGSQSSVFLRGAESDHTLVLLDGVPLNQPGGAIDLSGLTTENIERIEVVRGPVSGLYGSDAVAGVIHIITRSGGRGFTGAGTVRGGSFGRMDGTLEISGGNDSGSFAMSASRYSTDGILPFNNRHRNTVLSGAAELRIDDASSARVTARLLDRTYAFPTDETGTAVDVNQSSFSEEATIGLEVNRELGESLELRALATLHDTDSGTDDAPDGPEDDTGFYAFQSLDAMRRVAGNLRANWRPLQTLTLTAGVELEQQRIRSFSESLSEFGPSVGRSSHARSNTAGYLHGSGSLGPWALNGGARVEDNEQFGHFASFQVGSAVPVGPSTRLRFAAGRGIKEPTFFEAFAAGFVTGNPDLDPERSRSWEVGVEQELSSGVRLTATWFDQSLEDLIQFTFSPPEPTDPNYFNVAAADSKGLELELEAALGSTQLALGWSWLETEVTDSGFDRGPAASFVEGEALVRRPPNTLTAGLSGVAGSRVGWNLDLLWVDDRPDREFPPFPEDPRVVMLESYSRIDLGIEATILEASATRPGFDLLLRAENLNDAEYEEAFGFEAPGRGLYIGGRVRWGTP